MGLTLTKAAKETFKELIEKKVDRLNFVVNVLTITRGNVQLDIQLMDKKTGLKVFSCQRYYTLRKGDTITIDDIIVSPTIDIDNSF